MKGNESITDAVNYPVPGANLTEIRWGSRTELARIVGRHGNWLSTPTMNCWTTEDDVSHNKIKKPKPLQHSSLRGFPFAPAMTADRLIPQRGGGSDFRRYGTAA